MKVKKLLAGILSAAMVLGTMAVPVFADTDTSLPVADEGTITLENDVELNSILTLKNNLNLNGHTLTVICDENAFDGNITVSNGTIKVKKQGLAGNAVLNIGWNQTGSDVTFDNVIVEAQDIVSGCGLFELSPNSSFAINGGSIACGVNSITSNSDITKTIFKGQYLNGQKIAIKGTADKPVSINVGTAEKLFSLIADLDVEYVDFDGWLIEDMFAVISDGNIKNSTFTYTDSTTNSRAIVNDRGYKSKVKFENTKFENVPKLDTVDGNPGGTFVFANQASSATADGATTITKAEGVAAQPTFTTKVTDTDNNSTYYTSFDEAYSYAKALSGATLDLLGNTVTIKSSKETYNDLYYKNGTFNIASGCNFANAPFMGYGCKLGFDSVNFNATDYSGASGVIMVNTTDGNVGSMNLNNCVFNLKNDSDHNGALSGHTSNETAVIKNCTFNLTNTGRVFKLLKIDMSNSIVNAVTDSDHYDHAFKNITGKITDCKISATGEFESGIKISNGETLEISGNSSLTLDNDIILEDGSKLITKGGKYSMDVSAYCESGYTAAKIGDMYEVLKEETTSLSATTVSDATKVNKITEAVATFDDYKTGTTEQTDYFTFDMSGSKAKVIRATYNIVWGEINKDINADIVVKGLEVDGDLTLGIILYNIPNDATVTGPEFSTLQ